MTTSLALSRPLGGPSGSLQGLGPAGTSLRHSGGLWVSGGVSGALWGLSGTSLGPSGTSLGPSGGLVGLWRASGALRGDPLGLIWGLSGTLRDLSGALWGLVGLWGVSGALWGASGASWGAHVYFKNRARYTRVDFLSL